jgi:hypothetical protein
MEETLWWRRSGERHFTGPDLPVQEKPEEDDEEEK